MCTIKDSRIVLLMKESINSLQKCGSCKEQETVRARFGQGKPTLLGEQ
jgi:hypothetical protein